MNRTAHALWLGLVVSFLLVALLIVLQAAGITNSGYWVVPPLIVLALGGAAARDYYCRGVRWR